MNTVHELFVNELQDIYNAEKKLVEALGEAAEKAERSDLKKAFTKHRKQTEGHVKRLDQAFRSIGEGPEEKDCKGLDGLLEEKESIEEEDPSPEIRDLHSIGAARKVERYEMTAYESLILMAQQMKHKEAARLFKETLKEEQETEKLLSSLAKDSDVEWGAGMEGMEEEESGARRSRSVPSRRRTRVA
jgi:ferritin-like metal-binding protein YciE